MTQTFPNVLAMQKRNDLHLEYSIYDHLAVLNIVKTQQIAFTFEKKNIGPECPDPTASPLQFVVDVARHSNLNPITRATIHQVTSTRNTVS